MGSSASKAARKLPKRAEPPAWAGKRTPNPADPPAGVSKEQIRDKMASEHRTEAIERDARDPDFLANLQRLGPVKVDHHMKTVRPEAAASNTTELFKARQEHAQDLEQVAQSTNASIADDKFFASTLSAVLNARKGAKDPDVMGRVVEGHGIGFDKLESVARFVNTPSVAKEGVRTLVDKDGNERTIAKAVWIDAPYAELAKALPTSTSSAPSS